MMVRATLAFKNIYSLSVECVIRGHHLYKETWNPYQGKKLMCNHDKRVEAKIFEDHPGGTYKLVYLSRRVMTKCLLKSTAEENRKMA